jgi:hypothetical protein
MAPRLSSRGAEVVVVGRTVVVVRGTVVVVVLVVEVLVVVVELVVVVVVVELVVVVVVVAPRRQTRFLPATVQVYETFFTTRTTPAAEHRVPAISGAAALTLSSGPREPISTTTPRTMRFTTCQLTPARPIGDIVNDAYSWGIDG